MIENMTRNKFTISSNLYDYDVSFIDSFEEQLSQYGSNTAFIIDKNVYELYRMRLKSINEARVFFMDAVEEKKDMQTVLDILEFFSSIHVKKDWVVVVIGGGITQDVATIACDLYLRNVKWEFFPTTLLSMSDSCIGGKSGINYKNMKNQIGVFFPPRHIYIDTHFIETLKDEDYVNGWGELLKFSLTKDEQFYLSVKNEKEYIPCKNIALYLYNGLMTKKSIIEEDEFDIGVRRLLNYGHTFGHALEAYTNNTISHGRAVLWGMDVANYIALRKGMISAEYYHEVKELICRDFLKNEIVVSEPKTLFEILKTDKKANGSCINFALLSGRSSLVIVPVELNEELLHIFEDYLKATHDLYL